MGILSQLANKKEPVRKDFAIPELRKFPIGDETTARNTLARVKKFGNTEEKRRVKSAIKSRYPNMGVE